MMRREAALQPVDPDPRCLQVHCGDGQPAQFRLPETVSIHQQHHQMVPNAVATELGGMEKPLYLFLSQEVLGLGV